MHKKKRDERKGGRKDKRTNAPDAICPSKFSEVWGIKIIIRRNKHKFIPLNCDFWFQFSISGRRTGYIIPTAVELR